MRQLSRNCFLGLAALALLSGAARGENWDTFSHLVGESAFIAQFQVHTREGKRIGRRLVQIYWQAPDFDEAKFYWQTKDFEDIKAAIVRKEAWTVTKTWNLDDDFTRHRKADGPDDFNRQTDGLMTEFEFFGRGQHLWTASSKKGVIFYPGSTANPGTVMEFAGSEVEFHEVLVAASKLKRSGSKIEGNLELPVFGKRQLAK